MNLRQQAQQDVSSILGAYGRDLGQHRAYLDESVQETGGYWEEPNPDFLNIDPSVRAGHVRQFAAGLAARQKVGKPTLRLKIKSLAAYHLYTPDGQRIRTRNRPVDKKTRKPMRAITSDSEPLFGYDACMRTNGASEGSGPLFGYDPSAQPYELSVLLDVDLGTKTLLAASLAAIDWGRDDKGRVIYYEEEIPAVPMALNHPDNGTSPPPGAWGTSGSGFEDLLRDEGQDTGSAPA